MKIQSLLVAIALLPLAQQTASADPGQRFGGRLQQMADRLPENGRENVAAKVEAQRSARADARTEVFTAAAAVDAARIQAVLDNREEKILAALANADTETIAEMVNIAGDIAVLKISEADLSNLTPKQKAMLVGAANYAATITPDEIAVYLENGSLQVQAYFDAQDASAIAVEINRIGQLALDAQARKPSR